MNLSSDDKLTPRFVGLQFENRRFDLLEVHGVDVRSSYPTDVSVSEVPSPLRLFPSSAQNLLDKCV